MVSNYRIAKNFCWTRQKNFTKPSYLCIAEIFNGINFHQYYSHAQSHIHCLASSPGPSRLFSLAGKKRERAWDLKSRDICWQNGIALALLQSVDFKPVWRLWSIKCSSARPLRIVLPSLIVSVAFFFTHIEPERSKIALAHMQFSPSATLPTLVYGPTSRTWH